MIRTYCISLKNLKELEVRPSACFYTFPLLGKVMTIPVLIIENGIHTSHNPGVLFDRLLDCLK